MSILIKKHLQNESVYCYLTSKIASTNSAFLSEV